MKYVILTIALIILGSVAAEKFEHYTDKIALEKLNEYKKLGKPAYCDLYKN
jgi:hypothetical protein